MQTVFDFRLCIEIFDTSASLTVFNCESGSGAMLILCIDVIDARGLLQLVIRTVILFRRAC